MLVMVLWIGGGVVVAAMRSEVLTDSVVALSRPINQPGVSRQATEKARFTRALGGNTRKEAACAQAAGEGDPCENECSQVVYASHSYWEEEDVIC